MDALFLKKWLSDKISGARCRRKKLRKERKERSLRRIAMGIYSARRAQKGLAFSEMLIRPELPDIFIFRYRSKYPEVAVWYVSAKIESFDGLSQISSSIKNDTRLLRHQHRVQFKPALCPSVQEMGLTAQHGRLFRTVQKGLFVSKIHAFELIHEPLLHLSRATGHHIAPACRYPD